MVVGLASLPPEVVVEVAMHLGPKEWTRLASVNRAFRALFSHQPLWRRLHLSLHHQRRGESFPLVSSSSRTTTALSPREAEHDDWRWQCMRGWAADKWRNAARGRWRQRRLEGHQGSVRAVQLLQRYVLSGALDGRLKVWERDTGECRYTFAKHKGAVTCLHYDIHTRAMVSGSLDRTLQLYNLESGTTNSIPHAGQVLALRLHGDTLYTGGSHGLVFAYSLATLAAAMKKPSTTILTGHDGAITALATNKTGHLLASGGADATVKLCDPRVSRSVLPAKLAGHTAAISAISLRDTVAVSSSRATKGELLVWDIRNLGERNDGRPAALLRNLGGTNTVRSAFYDGTKLLSSTDGDNCVRVWDPRDWTCSAKWPHAAPVLCLDGSSTKAFVAGGQDYHVSLWEKKSRKSRKEPESDAPGHKRKRAEEPHNRKKRSNRDDTSTRPRKGLRWGATHEADRRECRSTRRR